MPKKFENTFPREWATYDYYDPKVILPGLQKIRLDIQQSETPEKIRNLRTNTLKGEREAWDAALFCYLLSKTIGIDIFFSKVEASNYDGIFKWHDGSLLCYAPVQMKELVPVHLNPTASLDKIIQSIKKYGVSPSLIIGIKLNREMQINLASINCSQLSVGEVWCYGATASDETKWSLFGDFLSEVNQYEHHLHW